MRTGGKELAFIATVLAVNAFVLLQGTGLVYEAFSWKAFAQVYVPVSTTIGGPDDPDFDAILGSGRDPIPNYDVFNPSGCLYNEATGAIVPGGTVTASLSCGGSPVNIPNGGDPMDGTMGCFTFRHGADCDPTYAFTITAPAGCALSTACPDQGLVATSTLSPVGEQFISIGNFPDTSLTTVSTACTPWHSQITMDAEDPSFVVNAVVNNNIALDCSSLCGNGVIDTTVGETCDDGNQVSGDGCASTCLGPETGFACAVPGTPCEAICGDTLVVGDEECDDGNVNDNDVCTNACTSAVCGDGSVCSDGACTTGPTGGVEDCDDANASDNDSCLNSCAAAACSDGVVCSDAATCTTGPTGGAEDCDDANPSDNDSCLNSCAAAACSDGVVCSDAASCTTGPTGGAEECDDGNGNDNDVCTNACANAVCGDGSVCTDGACTTGPTGGVEDCDDANASDNDSCLNSCAAAACSDGVVCSDAATCTTGPTGGAEDCDDANASDNDSCLNSCAAASCGDGILCSDEATCTSGPRGGIEFCDRDLLCTPTCDAPPAPAPALDRRGIVGAALALLALGIYALRRRDPATLS